MPGSGIGSMARGRTGRVRTRDCVDIHPQMSVAPHTPAPRGHWRRHFVLSRILQLHTATAEDASFSHAPTRTITALHGAGWTEPRPARSMSSSGSSNLGELHIGLQQQGFFFRLVLCRSVWGIFPGSVVLLGLSLRFRVSVPPQFYDVQSVRTAP